MNENLQTIVRNLTQGPDRMSEAQIAAALTADGVSVTQPTIHRIKNGFGTSFEIGCALVRLRRVKESQRRRQA